MSVVLDNLDLYLAGMRDTVVLTVLSFVLAFVLGIIVAGFRVSPVPPLRAVGALYVNTVRNTPLVLLLFLFYFGFPKVGLSFSAFTWAVMVLTLYTGSFVGETVRAGINSVSRGQGEAARALGLSFPQTLGVVVLPQAIRTVVQPLGSIFIALLRNSALVTVISVSNLSKTGDQISTDTAIFVPVYLGVAVAYLLLTIPSGLAVGFLERKLAIKR
ncbi:MAG TPA: amino acid ABC transporter permease [Acidimicrobiales bacterium]|nr:amino acid ABC transporter permease [Acidimicrobiales bacterium]